VLAHDAAAAEGESALGRCIACPPEVFAADYWSRRPLLSPAASLPTGAFADLLDASAVDELVAEHGLRVPFARMARDGSVLDAARFTRGGGAGATIGDQLADDRVLVRMAEGATLVLQALHRTWPPLVRFGARLAAELGHPVQINAYVTPPQNQGFAAHYDVHDVFVLQIAGSKRWTIHQPVVADPLPDQPWESRHDEVAARAAEDEPVLTAQLQPGDALYLPRGVIHSAQAMGATSIHLTVGVHPITRRHLVEQLVRATVDDLQLRSSLPMGLDLTDPDVLGPHVQQTAVALGAAIAAVPAEAVAEGIAAQLRRDTRPEPIGPLAQLAAASTVTGSTSLQLRHGLRYRLRVGPAGIRIELTDRTVTLPAEAERAVKTVLAGARFTPGELAGLAPEQQLATARLLLREGLVRPAPIA
jgi:bifunctional lysine-specific demethylase and histidyl-hydroxylase NO66